MSYCNIHNTNNCIECAITQQTKQIVRAIESLNPKPSMWARFLSKIKAKPND